MRVVEKVAYENAAQWEKEVRKLVSDDRSLGEETIDFLCLQKLKLRIHTSKTEYDSEKTA
jgi:hypothetical protein